MICRIGLRMVLLVASLFIVHLLSATTAEQCGTEYSIFGMMLMRHNFKTMKTSSAMECLHACRDDVRCQSLNYVIGEDSCELNDRTNKAKPEHFVPDSFRYYLTRDKNRGELLLFVFNILQKLHSTKLQKEKESLAYSMVSHGPICQQGTRVEDRVPVHILARNSSSS